MLPPCCCCIYCCYLCIVIAAELEAEKLPSYVSESRMRGTKKEREREQDEFHILYAKHATFCELQLKFSGGS